MHKQLFRIIIYILILATTSLLPTKLVTHINKDAIVNTNLSGALTKAKEIQPLSGGSFVLADIINIPTPQPTITVGSINCGTDPNMAYIYQHESGCNTGSVNASSGACGLGQAEPCSKLGGSLDWATQNAYFVNYAISRYGSTYNAMLFWEANSWW